MKTLNRILFICLLMINISCLKETNPPACTPFPGPVASSNSPVSAGIKIQLHAESGIPDAHYFWTGPGNFRSSSKDPVIALGSQYLPGKYVVRMFNNTYCPSDTSSTTVAITDTVPKCKMNVNTIKMSNKGTIYLYVDNNSPANGIDLFCSDGLWNEMSISMNFIPKKSGFYDLSLKSLQKEYISIVVKDIYNVTNYSNYQGLAFITVNGSTRNLIICDGGFSDGSTPAQTITCSMNIRF